MGNCSLKAVAAAEALSSIRIMTDSGEIVEFESPKLVKEVLRDFPGYGIYPRNRISSAALLDHQLLHGGGVYYLFPLMEKKTKLGMKNADSVREAEPVRMSTSAAAVEVMTPPHNGVWRVKLVIDTKQLQEILSQEVDTEALIEQMRLAASSASVAAPPKRGQWGGYWKPIVANLFKGNGDHRSRERSSDFFTGGMSQGKVANELNLAA